MKQHKVKQDRNKFNERISFIYLTSFRLKFHHRTLSLKILSQIVLETMPQTQTLRLRHLKRRMTRIMWTTQKHQRHCKVQNQSHRQQAVATLSVVVGQMKTKTNQVTRLSSSQNRLSAAFPIHSLFVSCFRRVKVKKQS